MAKRFEANDDWIKREGGRIPTKGAAAAERASAGLGTLTDDEALVLIGFRPSEIRGPEVGAQQSPAAGSGT
jgi:hypothetical protein